MEMRKRRQGTNKLPFGKILKGVMVERGLTVRAVSQMAGVRSSVVQGWISNSVPHDLESVARLAKALGMGFKSLLLGEPETNHQATTVSELFREQDFFEGICKVSIKRLLPRSGENNENEN